MSSYQVLQENWKKTSQISDMQPVKSSIHMWSGTRSSNKQLIGLASDKNCQATICEYDDFKSQSCMCFDKKCQENTNMQPVKPEMNMWLPKPAIKRLCNDKNSQSTRCYKKRNYDKNCQSYDVKIWIWRNYVIFICGQQWKQLICIQYQNWSIPELNLNSL